MLLRYLSILELKTIKRERQSNGSIIESIIDSENYTVQKQELSDSVSASLYGANIYKILRIKSVANKLEKFLIEKRNHSVDNLSKYIIYFEGGKYKIVGVSMSGIDIELI